MTEAREQAYFDSANIAESYCGVVMPLTFTFAKMVYGRVYRDLLLHSGVSRRIIDRYGAVFDGLLALFSGRMYYNMNNWYRLAHFVPGYRRNKANFEAMISSNVRADVEREIRPPFGLVVWYPLLVALKTLCFDATCRRFAKRVSREFMRLESLPLCEQSLAAATDELRRLSATILPQWYITVENDFFVMTYLGLLRRRLGETAVAKVRFRSKASEQVKSLSEIAQTAASDPQLWAHVASRDAKGFFAVLESRPDIHNAVRSYLLRFGGRFASELKLESVGIDEDPVKLLELLEAYRIYAPGGDRPSSRGGYGILERFLVSRFRKYASRREEFRLMRGNMFGFVRKLCRQAGAILAKEGHLAATDDVFYLKYDELLCAQSDRAFRRNMMRLVLARKKEYALYEVSDLPVHFYGAPESSVRQPVRVSLRGRPGSPGIIRGRAMRFPEFRLPRAGSFEIAVASHTDPGWTSLIALSKGLIIEHGGILSHASIVARELGIPAVIGAEGALAMLHDGDLVEINGTTGAITIL